MMSSVEQHKFDDVNVEDFIKQFTTTDSPARPQIIDYGSHFPQFSHSSESSPPYEGIGLSDLSGSSHSSEWLQNLDNIGLDSTLTPSSRGSSLETPSLPQNSTLIGSINPSRLKDVAAGKMASYPDHEGEAEPVWAMPVQVIPSNPLPTFAPSGISPAGDEAFTTPTPKASAHTKRATRKHDEMDDGTTPSKRIRRMSSLPEIYIPVVHQPVPRVLQRSASSGGIILPSQDDSAGSPFLQASPLEAPMSAPIPQQAQFSSYQMPANPAASMPTMHTRTYSNYSSLATIPEAPSSAPADVQWATVPQQVNQYVQQQQYQEQPQQQQQQQQQQQYQQQPHQQQQQQQHPQAALGFQYGNVQETSTYAPPPTASTLHSPALQSPMPPATPSLPSNMNGPKPPVAPSLPPTMGVSRPVMTHQHTLSASAIMPGGRPMQQQFRAYPQHAGNNPPNFGMGRPQPAHLRRSSDTELAFGTQANVGAMLRSTSVPQGPGGVTSRPATAGGIYQPQQQLPPPPPIGTNFTYQPSAMPLTPYQEHVQTQPGVPPNYGQIAIGRPAPPMAIGRPVPPTAHTMVPVTLQQQQQQQQQQQRKRVSSKRVGQCLKPGPKGKNKNKPDAIASAISSGATLPGGASSSILHLGPSGPNVLTGRSNSVATQPANMVPVTFDEFCAAFNRTPRGTLVPTPAMDMLIERLMYATDDTVVDACFRWCYTIGTEFNKAAQKQSKYFKCSFEECADSAQRIFMRKSAVDSHVRTHIGYRPYKCEVDVWCEARFVRKHDRDRHTQTTHKNEKSFECADCKQNFARSDALLRHRAKRDACKARIG